jgi:hypothetical protein
MRPTRVFIMALQNSSIFIIALQCLPAPKEGGLWEAIAREHASLENGN